MFLDKIRLLKSFKDELFEDIPKVNRVREMLKEIDQRGCNYWIKCFVCSGYTVYRTDSDLIYAFKKERCIQCGCMFEASRNDVGDFPKGKLFVWNAVEV